MPANVIDNGILETLAAIVGAGHLLTDEPDRRFYGTDVFRAGQLPVAVVLPGSIAELQDVVRVAARGAIPLTVRGGGASYTDGYTHASPGGITIGTDRLTAIEIDEAKSVVTVEAGVTWERLYQALKERGLRTPFWGPFSGLAATVGGSVSQNAISHGGGVSADSVVTMHLAMAEIARLGVDDENFGLDAALQQGQIGRNDSVSAKADIARTILKSSASLGAGMKALARMAVAGDRALKAADYAVHYLTDGVGDADARAKGDAIRAIASRHGTEIANSIPTVVRAMPFAPLANMLGPKGERWVPMHGLFAHDAAVPFHNALDAFWDEQRAAMDRLGVYNGAMFMAVGPTGFVYEPAFYWPDARHVVHDRMMPADHLATLTDYAPAPETAAFVAMLRERIGELMSQHGAAHLQIGKTYPYLAGRNPASMALLRAIKAELDPRNILNPGVLGL